MFEEILFLIKLNSLYIKLFLKIKVAQELSFN